MWSDYSAYSRPRSIGSKTLAVVSTPSRTRYTPSAGSVYRSLQRAFVGSSCVAARPLACIPRENQMRARTLGFTPQVQAFMLSTRRPTCVRTPSKGKGQIRTHASDLRSLGISKAALTPPPRHPGSIVRADPSLPDPVPCNNAVRVFSP